jgi:hypothetical protein
MDCSFRVLLLILYNSLDRKILRMIPETANLSLVWATYSEDYTIEALASVLFNGSSSSSRLQLASPSAHKGRFRPEDVVLFGLPLVIESSRVGRPA